MCFRAMSTSESPSNGFSPHQHLVEHNAEAVDIRLAVDRTAQCLLWTEIVGAADHAPGGCQAMLGFLSRLAIPKSVSSKVPSVRKRMLAGLTSRCTTCADAPL